jgi:lipopolysaccharide export LptBFGC system permease protein LptF
MILKLQQGYVESIDAKGTMTSSFATEAKPVVIQLKQKKDRKSRPNTMSNEEILQTIAADATLKPKDKVAMRAEITKRYSFSMACLAFAFIAIPLGLQSRRRDNSHGLILSLLIGTGYFLFTVLATEFKSDAGATAMLWAPNVACVLLGVVLFRRARFK